VNEGFFMQVVFVFLTLRHEAQNTMDHKTL